MTTTTTALATTTWGSNAMVASNSKTGMTSVRLLGAAEYRKEHGLKGAAGKRAYNAYLREQGIKLNEAVSKEIAGGRILLTGAKRWDKTGKIQFSGFEATKVVDPAAKAEKVDVAAAAASMSEAEREALIQQLLAMKKA